MRKPSLIHRASFFLLLIVSTRRCAFIDAPPTPDAFTTPTASGIPVQHTPTVTPVAEMAPGSPTATLPTMPTPGKLGIHMLIDDGRNAWPTTLWPEHLTYARRLVGDWGYVTELIRFDDLNTERWQYFMDLCAGRHLTPIIRLATTYNTAYGWWESPEPDLDGSYLTIANLYADFLSSLHWPSSDHYVIVGNEPNHGNEWGGRPDPAAYAGFLIAVADAVHSADPQARILNAGLDPYTPHTGSVPFIDGLFYMDEETFLDEMHRTHPDVFTRLDLWASHAYPTGPLTEGPWQQTYQVDMINDASNPYAVSPPAGVVNRGINGYVWELFKLSTYGVDALPVMITETGWRHAETTDPTATDNGRSLPDAATVAQYFDLALHGNDGRYPDAPETGWTPWLEDPRVVAVTPFALNGYPPEWGHTNWLALNNDGTVTGVYASFELLATGEPQP